MDVLIIVLQSVLVLLGIGIVGFWITRRGIIPENVLGFLSQLALDIALPCLVFSSIMANFSPSSYPDWWQLPLWWLAFTAIALVLTLITRYISNKDTRAEFSIGLFYQNGIFFPLVIISGIFGTDTPFLVQLFIFMALHPTMYFSTYHLFFKKAGGAVIPIYENGPPPVSQPALIQGYSKYSRLEAVERSLLNQPDVLEEMVALTRARGLRLARAADLRLEAEVVKALLDEEGNDLSDTPLARLSPALESLEGAMEDFDRAITLDPRSYDAYNLRGVVYNRLGDTREALYNFQRAIDIDQTRPEAYDNKAIALTGVDDPVQAQEDCDEATRLAPGYAESRMTRMEACERTSSPRSTAKAYQNFVRFASPETGIQIGLSTERLKPVRKNF